MWVGGLWLAAFNNWPIALAMVFGSYFAGSTPMGGGTVGFPVLVLAFGESASLGRHFSFVIQAVGMTSASIFILCSRRPLAVRLLLWAMVGSGVTLPLSLILLVPHVSEPAVKLTFACIWAGFGIMTLVKLREMLHTHHVARLSPRMDALAGLSIGVVGGVAASLTGVGIDMVAYCVLVLIYRCDLRIAVATSVVVMAFDSVVGSVTSAALNRLDAEVLHHWVAAAPVVLIGAPIGAYVLHLLPRGQTLIVVSVLCLAQLVWTLVDVDAGAFLWLMVLGVVLAMNAVFHLMYRWGRVLVPDRAEGHR